jgi:predicted nucleic acid-binding protein
MPRMRRRHGLSDDEILEFVASLLAASGEFAGQTTISPRLPRDVTDTKFPALAAESHADYLVTNDRRHLLPLKKFQHTRIVTPRQFLAALS